MPHSLRFPALYDRVMPSAEGSWLTRMRRETAGRSSGIVVEIAAGTGLNFPCYRPDAVVIATEPDLGMLALAQPRAARAKAKILLVAADARDLPFRAAAFDTAVVTLGLCTIPAPKMALRELHRVLGSSGMIRLLEHVRVEQPVIARIQDLLTPLWRRVAGGCRLNERPLQALRDAGFTVRELHSHARGFFITITCEKNSR